MSLNTPALNQAVYAAFRKQAVKQGPDKSGTDMQLATDLTNAIQQYVLSGNVNVIWIGIGWGIAIAPWPGFVAVYKVPAGVGIGFIK
tara:strand:+ start:4179 stop:4439 length:261 start_codon:yes stop_codon:yes gene_type:complete